MQNGNANDILEKILEEIDLPDSAYEKAKDRYQSLGQWLQRPESSCADHDPHVSPSGSFRLGLANRPVDNNDAYDLDMACNLNNGITKASHTQKELKSLVGNELELYRNAKGISKKLDEKRRCWTLEYGDKLNFHMDILPCIPESATRQVHLREAMRFVSKLDVNLAGDVAALAVSITDNTDANYTVLTDEWRISNPEGFAKWFESRMKIAREFIESRQLIVEASIETLPFYRWKTPLQQAIQILKQHRDIMFRKNPESKPISVIITTLASHAYQGELDVASALQRILDDMDSYINEVRPLVPNPVNPAEDFADKWYSAEHAKHNLQANFFAWLRQARAHFKNILEAEDLVRIVESAESGLNVKLNEVEIAGLIGAGIVAATQPQKVHASSAKPWAKWK
ncbi:MAG: nucleotidyltransferase [Blastopirellula sp.]|nr:MAG: nucleotidyltransferase [Blastopirellula sp.]